MSGLALDVADIDAHACLTKRSGSRRPRATGLARAVDCRSSFRAFRPQRIDIGARASPLWNSKAPPAHAYMQKTISDAMVATFQLC